MRADHILHRRLTFAFAAIGLIALLTSCSGLWTSLHNPVDPTNCEVDEKEYWRIFSNEESYDDILEQLRYESGYHILYLGFNDGTYASWDMVSPFVVITTKDSVQTYEQDGMTIGVFPLFNSMTVYDQMGNAYTANIGSWSGENRYTASDGKQYPYYVATFYMNGLVDMAQTYTVQIDHTNVYANDGTPLDRSYYFTVWNDTNAPGQAMDLFEGLSSRLFHDFSLPDENWSWREGDSSGEILTDLGVYSVRSRISGNVSDKAYFKRYPYQIPEGDFAVQVEVSYPDINGGPTSGLYVSDAAGTPAAVITVEPWGWLSCYAPGSSGDRMRKILERSVPDFNRESVTLGLRREGSTMCYCVNGAVFAREDVSGSMITNAGVLVNSSIWVDIQTVYFDNFEIAY